MECLEYIESLIRAHSDINSFSFKKIKSNIPILNIFNNRFSLFCSEYVRDFFPIHTEHLFNGCRYREIDGYRSIEHYFNKNKLYPDFFNDFFKLRLLYSLNSYFNKIIIRNGILKYRPCIPNTDARCASQIYICLNTAVYIFHYNEELLVFNNYIYSDDDIKKIIKNFMEIMNYYLLSFRVKEYKNINPLNIKFPVQCIERNDIDHLFNSDGYNMNNIKDINSYLEIYLPETFSEMDDELFNFPSGSSLESIMKWEEKISDANYYESYNFLFGDTLSILTCGLKRIEELDPVKLIENLELLTIIPNDEGKYHITKGELDIAKKICIQCNNIYLDNKINIYDKEREKENMNDNDWYKYLVDKYLSDFYEFYEYIKSLDIKMGKIYHRY